MKTTVIIGATSAIGAACIEYLSGRLILVGRNAERLEAIASEARLQGKEVETTVLDLSQSEQVKEFAGNLMNMKLDQLILTAGDLSDEGAEYAAWLSSMTVNVAAQTYLARVVFDQIDEGAMVFVGSVAGDRGRQSNAWYGAQKSALEIFGQGLTHRAATMKKKIAVSVIKPGFVRSPMTRNLPESVLFSEPEVVARKVVKVLERAKSQIVYVPGWWRLILLVVKFAPRFILHRTQL